MKALESSIYAEDELSLGKYLKLNLGLRGTVYSTKDTAFYRLEPRISARLLLSEQISLKANYTKLNQYNHVLVNNNFGFEKEIWLAATKNLLPQQAQQVSAGIFYGNELIGLDISVEGFYKTMKNLLEYKSPVNEDENFNNIENIAAKEGKGKAYGLEFQIKKEFEKFNVNLSYTISRNFRQFEELNNGKEFPFIYDRLHDLSIVTIWQISERYSFSSNFVLSSGMPFTLPIGFSKTDDFFHNYYIYEDLNNRKLPMYHRLDISIVRKRKTKRGHISSIALNVFNVYARQNPVYIYYNNNTGKVYQKSLFSIIPTLTYTFQL